MTRIFLTFCLSLLLSVFSFSQKTTLLIYSEDGLLFTLYLNGEKINETPKSSITLDQVNYDFVQIKVVFEKTLWGTIEKSKAIISKGFNNKYVIRMSKKGELNLVWQVPSENVPEPVARNNSNNPPPATTTTTVTTTTTESQDKSGINLSLGGVSIGIGNGNGAEKTTTTTTVITTAAEDPCKNGMSYEDLQDFKRSLEDELIDNNRRSIYRNRVAAGCITSRQVKETLMIFKFDNFKLELAKYAYSYVNDPQNYLVVNDVFSFETSKMQLKNYVLGNPR